MDQVTEERRSNAALVANDDGHVLAEEERGASPRDDEPRTPTGVDKPNPFVPEPGKLPFITFSRVMQAPLPTVEWDVEPLFARGDRGLLYAEWGALKTWLALDLGLSLAAGRDWLGHFRITKARRVLYIDEEMNPRTLWRRIKRLGLGMKAADDNLPFRALSRQGIVFDERKAEKLLADLRESGFVPEVVIIDTYRRVSVGNENEAERVTNFWRNAGPLLRAGMTVIILHHMRKKKSKKESSRDRASGSTDHMASVDVALSLERTGECSVIVECQKTRESVEADEFVVTLWDDGDRNGPVTFLYGGDTGKAAQSEIKEAGPLALALLDQQGSVKTADILDHLMKHGVTKRTAERTLARLRELRHIESVKGKRGLWRSTGANRHSATSIEETVAAVRLPAPTDPLTPSGSSANGSASVPPCGGKVEGSVPNGEGSVSLETKPIPTGESVPELKDVMLGN